MLVDIFGVGTRLSTFSHNQAMAPTGRKRLGKAATDRWSEFALAGQRSGEAQ
jgi:hypothetical protein